MQKEESFGSIAKMYITLFDKLVEFILDIGVNGFGFCLYISEKAVLSIDTSYVELALPIIAIGFLRRKLWKLK